MMIFSVPYTHIGYVYDIKEVEMAKDLLSDRDARISRGTLQTLRSNEAESYKDRWLMVYDYDDIVKLMKGKGSLIR